MQDWKPRRWLRRMTCWNDGFLAYYVSLAKSSCFWRGEGMLNELCRFYLPCRLRGFQQSSESGDEANWSKIIILTCFFQPLPVVWETIATSPDISAWFIAEQCLPSSSPWTWQSFIVSAGWSTLYLTTWKSFASIWMFKPKQESIYVSHLIRMSSRDDNINLLLTPPCFLHILPSGYLSYQHW